MGSYRSLFESSQHSLDNNDKLVANESRDTVVDIIRCLRSDETILPAQKAHVDKIVAEALSILRNTHRFIIISASADSASADSAPADMQNLSVIDTLSDTAVSGGAGASDHLDSVQGIQKVGQTPTESGQVNSVDPVADTDRSHEEAAGRSDSRTIPDDRRSLSGDEDEDDYLSPSESASLAELRESENSAKEGSARTRIHDAADRASGGDGSRPSVGGTAPAADSDTRGRRVTRVSDAAGRAYGGDGSRPLAGGTVPAADSDASGRRVAPAAAQRGSGHVDGCRVDGNRHRVDGCDRSGHAGDRGDQFSTPSVRRVRIDVPAGEPNHDSMGGQNAFFENIQSLLAAQSQAQERAQQAMIKAQQDQHQQMAQLIGLLQTRPPPPQEEEEEEEAYEELNDDGDFGQVQTDNPPETSENQGSMNPDAQTFLPTQCAKSEDQNLQASLLTIQIQNQARDLMIQSRPPKEHRFGGKKNEDLDSMLAAFDSATNAVGITDQMKRLEYRHYCQGNAWLVVEGYSSEVCPSVALVKIREHLRMQFGRTQSTAREMLDDLLSGAKIDHKNPESTVQFLLKLNNCYKRAVETGRESSFATMETYEEIFKKKLGFLYGREWGKRFALAEEKCRVENSNKSALSFNDFLQFCNTQVRIGSVQKRFGDAGNQQPMQGSGGGVGRGAGNGSKQNNPGTKTEGAMAPVTTSKPRNGKKGRGRGKPGGGPGGANPGYAAAPAGPKPYAAAAKQAPAAPKPNPEGSAPPKAASAGQGNKVAPGHCCYCKKPGHKTSSCFAFKKLTRQQRVEAAKKGGFCFLCTGQGHLSKDCEEPPCTTCQGRHNELFCKIKWPEPQEAE